MAKAEQYIDWVEDHQRRILSEPNDYDVYNILAEQEFFRQEGAPLHHTQLHGAVMLSVIRELDENPPDALELNI